MTTIVSDSLLLQESREGGTREHGNTLLESLDLIIASCLPKLKILQCKVAALVQIGVFIGQLLKLTKNRVPLCLCLDLGSFCLGFHFGFGNNVLCLHLNGCIGVLHEIFVHLLGVFLTTNGLRLHRLGVINDALHHAHDTAGSCVLFVRLEAWRWCLANDDLVLACLLDKCCLIIEALKNIQSSSEKLL